MAYSVAQRVISKKTAFTIIVMISAENQSCCITLPSFVSGIFLPDMKEHLTSNEAEVFGEVKLLHESYPGIHVQK